MVQTISTGNTRFVQTKRRSQRAGVFGGARRISIARIGRSAHRFRAALTFGRINALLGIAIAALSLLCIGGTMIQRFTRNRNPPVVRVTVRRGDTLWSLADRYGSQDDYILRRVQALAAGNGLRAGEHLQPGMVIEMPVENKAEMNRMLAAATEPGQR